MKKESYARFKTYVNLLHAVGNHVTNYLSWPSKRYPCPERGNRPADRKWSWEPPSPQQDGAPQS